MDYQAAGEVWREIRATRFSDLRQDLVDLSIRYARLRVDHLMADPDRRASMDADRSACHNALIASCDILARNMDGKGEPTGWRITLGSDRKVIGDFACFLHAILGVSNR